MKLVRIDSRTIDVDKVTWYERKDCRGNPVVQIHFMGGGGLELEGEAEIAEFESALRIIEGVERQRDWEEQSKDERMPV